MRSFLLWASLSLISPSVCAALPAENEDAVQIATEDVSEGSTISPAGDGKDAHPQYTVFNGIQVPLMKEINGESFNETIKDGYWFVEYFSPSCPHCTHFAPTWQTLYEFYYTSSPVQPQAKSSSDASNTLNGFHGYYDFHFARVNCLAFGDACTKNNVRSWPTLKLYKSGELVEDYSDDRSMATLSHYVEEKLEQIRPGSRPREGLNVPEVGAKEIDRDVKPQKPLAKDKNAAAGAAAGEKHNDQIAALADASTTAMTASATARAGRSKDIDDSRPPANPQGKSISLTAESFQKLVTTTQDAWFIKFYAPWCGHCQALAPTWAQMAKEMKNQLNIGEVNCDIESRLCKDARVQGYPTVHYFRGGERVEYDGLRGLGDLLSFAGKALDSDVKYVDEAQFKAMEETEEVIFTYFFDDATTSEDFAALDRLTLSLIGHAKIVKTDSRALAKRFKISTWPRLLVSRDGRPSYYTALAPKDMRDFRRVLTWMQSVWLPLVPELTVRNAVDILSDKFVVLGLLSRQRPDDFLESKREVKNAALEWMDKQTREFQLERQQMRDDKQVRLEEAEDRNDQRALRQAKSQRISIAEEDFRKAVTFAWVDGVFWERWLRMTYGIDVVNGDRVIINDEEMKQYWDTTASGASIMPSRSSILETLAKVTSSPPKITPKSTIGTIEKFFFHIRNLSYRHPYLSLALAVVATIAAAVAMKRRMRTVSRYGGASAAGTSNSGGGGGGIGIGIGSGGPGYFTLDGKEGLLNGLGVGTGGATEKKD